MEEIIDITKCTYGTVLLGGAESVAAGTKHARSKTAPTAGGGSRKDTTQIELTASVRAQDPLAIPAMLALSQPQSLITGGRLVGTSTFVDWTLLHCLLTGFGFDLTEGSPSSASFEFQNRATAGNGVADEWDRAVGTRQAVAARETLLRFVAGADTLFTDDAAADLLLLGLDRFSLSARPAQVYAKTSGGPQILADQVDVSIEWDGTGSMTVRDTTVTDGQAIALQLEAMRRGDLSFQVQTAGQSAGAAAPVDKIVTVKRLKFFDARKSLRSLQPGAWDVSFDWEMISSAGARMTLAEMITMADAA